ncbi:hypothetical protein LTR56_001382 [Elasticomyces elasticus]|nr:hypothetical protein LTR56_001382 [Elasticomyces elasticus]KAK3668693.1 hypothetical protein LTR22_000581 [Elasticomyces elasticus]KAK4932045.1 hypothetical protein LTR49_001733 [Elasticomyces elasticus]KAK5768423.1 hypothetical protein LTS12_001210 [Elasticomyces elasticus]
MALITRGGHLVIGGLRAIFSVTRATQRLARNSRADRDSQACLHIRRIVGHATSADALGDRVAPTAHDDTANEKFYQRYLTFKIRRRTFRPCHKLLELDPQACREALPKHLQDNPLDAFDDPNTTLLGAAQSLEAFISNTTATGNLSKLREKIKNYQTGTVALSWYSNSGVLHRDDPDYDLPRFFRALALCITAEDEDADNHMWKLILLKDDGPGSNDFNRARIRGDLLRWMVEAQALWAPRTAPLDKAFRTFFRAVDISRKGIVHIPTGFAISWLEGPLESEVAETVSQQDYDRFIQQTQLWKKEPSDAGLAISLSSLFRPKPDLSYALNFWKRAESQPDSFTRHLLSARRSATQYVLFWHLTRLAQSLRRNGDLVNARWVLDFGRKHVPAMFKMQPPKVVEDAGPLVDKHNLQRPSTPMETLTETRTPGKITAVNLRRRVALKQLL